MEIRRAFHEELAQLTTDTVRLAVLARTSIHDGTAALLALDLEAAAAVIDNDRALDALTDAIEERAFDLIARQQPTAVDLRLLLTILRVIHELERVGDLMLNVVKGARRLYPHELPPAVRSVIDRMGRQAMDQLALATEAFAERNVARARSLPDMDDAMDDLQRDLFRVVFADGAGDEEALQRAVQVALIGRYYERVADHAVNFGERVEFVVTGQFAEHARAGDEQPEEPA